MADVCASATRDSTRRACLHRGLRSRYQRVPPVHGGRGAGLRLDDVGAPEAGRAGDAAHARRPRQVDRLRRARLQDAATVRP